MKKVILFFLTAAILTGCATPFNERVKEAQAEIEASFKKLGYSPNTRDVMKYKVVPRMKRDREWEEKQISFRDHGDRSWVGLHKFFVQDADYNFDYGLRIGDSTSDIEKIRWFEIQLDDVFTIYRIGFVKRVKRKQ